MFLVTSKGTVVDFALGTAIFSVFGLTDLTFRGNFGFDRLDFRILPRFVESTHVENFEILEKFLENFLENFEKSFKFRDFLRNFLKFLYLENWKRSEMG